jgi:hypothetical protein
MTVRNSNSQATSGRKLVLRRIADRPALPAVRPPPRPSFASLDPVRPPAGSLPPVAASWPPPADDAAAGAPSMPRAAGGATLAAYGVAICGAVLAAAAGLIVVPRAPAPPVLVRPASGVATARAAGHRARPGPTETSPWMAVPASPLGPAAVSAPAIAASALPVARASAAPRPPSRAATPTVSAPPISSALDRNATVPAERNVVPAPAKAAPSAATTTESEPPANDPVLQAVKAELVEPPRVAPTP